MCGAIRFTALYLHMKWMYIRANEIHALCRVLLVITLYDASLLRSRTKFDLSFAWNSFILLGQHEPTHKQFQNNFRYWALNIQFRANKFHFRDEIRGRTDGLDRLDIVRYYLCSDRTLFKSEIMKGWTSERIHVLTGERACWKLLDQTPTPWDTVLEPHMSCLEIKRLLFRENLHFVYRASCNDSW